MPLFDIVDLYQNFKSEFYVRKQYLWALGESGHSFGLDDMRKSKLQNKFKKIKKTKIIEFLIIGS